MTKSKTIFYQAQEAVVSALNQDEVLSSRVPFVSENQLDIEFQIKSALGKQGIVGIVMTPQAAYQGTYQGQDQVWDLRDFTIQVVENPIVNRTLSASRDPMTAFDAVTRATEVLASPLSPIWGQYCPTTIEQGEDSGLLVAQTKFNCQIRADKGPERKTKWKYAGSDEWHEALVEGEFTSSSLPDIGSISDIEIGYAVTSIGVYAFSGSSALMSVTIPGSVTDIGNFAFRGCIGLSSIEFGDSLTSIGATAFTKCSSLAEATLPESIQSIGANAFSDCTSMTQLLFEGKTDRQVKAMANYSWGLPDGVARGAVIETFSVNWYVTDGTTSSTPGGYVAGDVIRFDTDDASKSLQFVSVNGVEISDTSVYGESFYEYVVQEEDVFLQVKFAVPQAKAVFSFTGTNVSCDLPDGEYCVGKAVNFQTLPVEDALSSMQTSMLSAVYVNGVLDLDVARSFGRPSLSASTWQYVLKEGENTVDASADLLPYCKDRTHYWVGYNSSNGALSWRSCSRADFILNDTNPQIYITGPARMPNYSGGVSPKTFDWTTPYGDAVDWTDIEEVFVPCAVYNTPSEGSTAIGVYLRPAAFANMPSLRKVKFDCMRPSDPGWNRFGNRGNGPYWTADSVYVDLGSASEAFGGAVYLFYNSPNLEEVDFSYDEGGIFRITADAATVPYRFVNLFYGTKLKELKMRIYCAARAQSTGAFQGFQFTEYLNGIMNYDGTFKLVLDYVRKQDGYLEDSNALPIGNLIPVAATTTTPKYRPKIAEIRYPYMSEGQLAQTRAWTVASNRNIATAPATRAAASEGLSTLIIPNWASNAVIGGVNFLNPSETLREVVLLSGSTVPSTTAAWWASRELTSLAQLSGSTMPCSPLPNVSVYVPDSLYTQFQANAQWSQLSSRGYDLKPVSTWPRLNPGA